MIADHISIEGLIGFSTFVPGALLTALLGFYYQLRTLAAASAQRQPSWEEARLSLGLTMRQAIGLSTAKFFLWHNLQPTAYLWVFNRYFGCSEFMDESQRLLGSIVAAREIIYMFSTVVAAVQCPVYLLLDVRTVVKEAETRFQSAYRVFAYLTTPHNFVSLCPANYSAELRLVFLPLALCQVIADFASCFALGPLLFSGAQPPAAIKIGYTITAAGFLLFFGPLTVLSLLRTARDKGFEVGEPRSGRFVRVLSAVAGTALALGLLYVILGFVIAAYGADALCGSVSWFWFMAPDCGEHGICGAVIKGECGPCTGDFITSFDALDHRDNLYGDLCQVDCGDPTVAGCGAHGRWNGEIVGARVAGVCGCTCSDGYGGDRCQNPCSGFQSCGAHGNWKNPDVVDCNCTCSDGYVTGGQPAWVHTPGPVCRLAPTYILSGALDSAYDGRYERLVDRKSEEAPVYQLADKNKQLNRVMDGGFYFWRVGATAHSISIGDIYSDNYDGCPDSPDGPDGAGCTGRWNELVARSTYDRSPNNYTNCHKTGTNDIYRCSAPNLKVTTCPVGNPCCGLHCGGHGSLSQVDFSNGSTTCSCSCAENFRGYLCDFECHCGGGAVNNVTTIGSCGGASCSSCAGGYIGEFCQLPSAYTIAGAVAEKYNGRYERLPYARCRDKPVYQLGASDGPVLFQPTDDNRWMVAPSDHRTSCATSGYIESRGSCATNPGGVGCVGKWEEANAGCPEGVTWCSSPGLTVTVAVTAIP